MYSRYIIWTTLSTCTILRTIFNTYQITQNIDKETLILKYLTMVDPETGWFENFQYDENKNTLQNYFNVCY